MILSHTINRNIIKLTNEIVDPIDEIIFHGVLSNSNRILVQYLIYRMPDVYIPTTK